MELILGALAAFYVWTVLRFLLPFTVPDRLALLLYGGVAGLVLQVHPAALLALAVAGVVTLLVLGTSLLGVHPEHWSLPRPHRPGHRKLTGLGHVPGAKPGKVGRRIPRL